LDIDLLSICADKNTYQRFKPYIKEHVLSKEAQLVFNTFEPFFKGFPSVTKADWTAFESYFFVLRNSQVRKETAPSYKIIFDKLKAGATTSSLEEVLKHYITQDYATRIADTALQVRDGSASIDDVAELVSKCDKELGRAITPMDLFVTGGVEDILKEAAAPGLEWRLEELNISLGPLRKGDFVLVAAYVETGKTTFAASEVSHMASQIKDDRPIVWVNNEERSAKVVLRIQQAALGMTMADITKDYATATASYEKAVGKNRILVLSNDNGLNSVGKLTPLFRDLNPALIVFDQLDKVAGFHSSDEGEHSRLGRLYKWARELSHEYGPVLAISQTDASGSTSKYIGMDQLRGSKVDKPGEADAIITIGKGEGAAEVNKRYIHVPKNKLFGGPRSDEKERHGYWEVEINPAIARYEGTR
jgi:replicative DNA helicase